MGNIKSALEIALERTASIKSDPVAGSSRELRNKGKKIVSNALESKDFAVFCGEIESYPDAEKKYVIEGAVSVLIAGINLPESNEHIEKAEHIGKILDILLPNNQFIELFSQVSQIFTQYIADTEQLRSALVRQFEPKLRAKEAEFAQRYGQTVQLQPEQDSEFLPALNKNMSLLKQRYEGTIDEVRQRVREGFGLEIDE